MRHLLLECSTLLRIASSEVRVVEGCGIFPLSVSRLAIQRGSHSDSCRGASIQLCVLRRRIGQEALALSCIHFCVDCLWCSVSSLFSGCKNASSILHIYSDRNLRLVAISCSGHLSDSSECGPFRGTSVFHALEIPGILRRNLSFGMVAMVL